MKIYADRMYLAAVLHTRRITEDQVAAVLCGDPPVPSESLLDALWERGLISQEDRQQFAATLTETLTRCPSDPEVMLRTLSERSVEQVLPDLHDAAVRSFLTGQNAHNPAGDVSIAGSIQYSLDSLVGAGGLGIVWKARDLRFNREVAVKRIRPGLGANASARHAFMREAQITAQLQHPNIVPVYSMGEAQDGDDCCYAMRLVNGTTLGELIAELHQQRRGERLPRTDLLRLLQLFLRIAEAVGYANSRGVIHRDLKPSNILVGDFGEAVVIDWGLATTLQDAPIDNDLKLELSGAALMAETRSGSIVGSPLYMAPEQAISGQTLSVRTDVFGLGAILFSMLAGRPPNKSDQPESSEEMIARIAKGEIPRLCHVDPTVPAALDAICSKAVAADPKDRYADAAALADDVRRWLVGEPLLAYREPWRRRIMRWLAISVVGQFTAISCVVLIIILTVFALNTITEVSVVTLMRGQAMKLGVDAFEFHLRNDVARMRKDLSLITSSESVVNFLQSRIAGDAAEAALHKARFTDQLNNLLKVFPQYFSIEFIALEPQTASVFHLVRPKGAKQAILEGRERNVASGEKSLVDSARTGSENDVLIIDDSSAHVHDRRFIVLRGAQGVYANGRLLGVLLLRIDLSSEIKPFFPPQIYNSRLIVTDNQRCLLFDSDPNTGDSNRWLAENLPQVLTYLSDPRPDVSEFVRFREGYQLIPCGIAYVRKFHVASGDNPIAFGLVAIASLQGESHEERWIHFRIFLYIAGICLFVIAILISAVRTMLQMIRGL